MIVGDGQEKATFYAHFNTDITHKLTHSINKLIKYYLLYFPFNDNENYI